MCHSGAACPSKRLYLAKPAGLFTAAARIRPAHCGALLGLPSLNSNPGEQHD
jgi:hypothetical protein